MKRRHKIYVIISMVLFVSFFFVPSFSYATQYEYAVWLDGDDRPTATYQVYESDGSTTGPVDYMTNYIGRATLGGIQYSRWTSSFLDTHTSKDTHTVFHFDFNKTALPAHTGNYNIAFAFNISNFVAIQRFPTVYDVVFTNSNGDVKSLFNVNGTSVSGNVCYVRSTVTQPLEGNFSLDIILSFPIDWQSDAQYFNISTVRFTRPFDSGDVVNSIQISTDAIVGAINGDGTYDNPAGDAAMDNLNNYGSAEEEIMNSLPESEFNFSPVEILKGFNGGFPVVSTILNGIINHKAILPIITFILALGLALFILGRRVGK